MLPLTSLDCKGQWIENGQLSGGNVMTGDGSPFADDGAGDG